MDHFLTFSLGADTFAMDIRDVREIIQVGPLTPVPLMPRFVRGAINLRGAVMPVIDLNARLQRGRSDLGKKSCIVVFDATAVNSEHIELGLLVDAVSAVVGIPDEQIEETPHFGTAVPREFIRGLGKVGERFIAILEPARAFDIDEMAALCAEPQLEAAA